MTLYSIHVYIQPPKWNSDPNCPEKPLLRPSTTRGWSGGISRTFGAVNPAVKDVEMERDGWMEYCHYQSPQSIHP